MICAYSRGFTFVSAGMDGERQDSALNQVPLSFMVPRTEGVGDGVSILAQGADC